MTAAEAAERIRDALRCGRPGCECRRPAGNTHCPAHDDPGPSLSVAGKDGKVLLKCFGGCDQGRVLAALGERGLWPPSGEAVRRNGHGPAHAQRQPGRERRWDAIDPETGAVIATHVRVDLPPDHETGKRRKRLWWKPRGITTAELPLYGWERLAEADHAVICEGEPTADAANVLLAGVGGVVAVGTVTGAGAIPCDRELARLLLVPRVTILGDSDRAGRDHAQRLANGLLRLGHRDVRQLDAFPNSDGGESADDLLARGTTTRDFMALLETATPARPADADTDGGSSLGHNADRNPGPRLVIRSLADVQPRAVDWVWERWAARGKLHLLAGLMGEGKGTLTAALAAAFSTGGYLPDGTRAPLIRTLFVLSEDALDDTLRPRLDVHGADARKVDAIEAVREPSGSDRMVNLSRHLPLIEAAIRERDAEFVVFDAISDFMSGTDRNAEGEVRDVLTPLAQMADRTNAAILGVMHLGKPSGTNRRVVQMLLGSTAFGAVARVVWATAEIPESGGHRVLEVVKSNLAIKPPAVEWSRAEDAAIAWHGETEHRVEAIIGASLAKPRDDAEGFLRELLRCGMVEVARVEALAKAAGLSWSTVRRAADERIGVKKHREGFGAGGRWFWGLPPDDAAGGAA